ncbi:MAG: hypothetical protein LBK05_02280 [Treponema sp.]|jgi:hypothetical protein|nr:hypothetical protein [Treponema sp.]
MTRISVHGNEAAPETRGKTDRRKAEYGSVLLDALLCLFISGIIFGIVVNSQDVRRRALTELTEHTGRLIEERNLIDRERTGINEKQ